MTETKKLAQEELQELQAIKQEVIALASALGELEYQKTLIEFDSQRLKAQVKVVKDREQTLVKSFGEKYGDGIINLETGDVTPRN